MPTTQKLLVLEANEVPLRVFRHYAGQNPASAVARCLAEGMVAETVADDVAPGFLYPSQTWASLNTGAAYDDHRIHWYNDSKPDAYPMYWRRLADAGRSVGLVSSLHAAPMASFDHPQIRFLVPDCFAEDSQVKPGYVEAFQRLNLRASAGSARVAQIGAPAREMLAAAATFPRLGIRLKSMMTGAATVAGAVAGRINRERIRSLQFVLMSDIFDRLVRKHDPDLAVLFTNHVAATMHRYWYALFPGDYREQIYDEDWIRRYDMEIMAAMRLFDDYLDRAMAFAVRTDRILVVVSSMGQVANPGLTRQYRIERSVDFRLDDVNALVRAIVPGKLAYTVLQAMVPQYTLGFPSEIAARAFADQVAEASKSIEGLYLVCDCTQDKVTLTTSPDTRQQTAMRIGGKVFEPEALGFSRLKVEDHHSGHHDPRGSLLVFNSRSASLAADEVNYLEYTPAVLRHFGVATDLYMKSPSFTL